MRILLLGGSSEASALARMLACDSRFAPILSLAGRTAAPALPPIPCRIGGFGGVDGLVNWLREHGTECIVDATHPFAARITANAVAAGQAAGIPVLRVSRPPWRAQDGDRWLPVGDMVAAAAALGDEPRRVLLTVGRQELAPFRAAPRHHYVIRSVEPPDDPPPSAEIIAARGPFAEADERALLCHRRIGVIVTKNSGGAATGGKLAAARALGVPVVMVQRPHDSLAVLTPEEGYRRLLDHAGTARGV